VGANGVTETTYQGRKSTSPMSTWLRNRSRVLRDHEVTPISARHAELVEWVPRGGTWRDIPPHLLPERFRGIRRTDSTNLYGRLDPNLPAYTISTQFNNPSAGCYTHPYETRTLSVREGARLQTFPDSYQFAGSLESRCRQIGNAVPPLLASVLANAVADQLQPIGRRPAWRKKVDPIRPTYAQPSDKTRARMRLQRRADTGPEVAVRSLLHRRGLRFRKQVQLLGDRRTVDIVFPSQGLAVSILGCFWHGCPEHARPTKSNTVWWAEKIANNRKRDTQTKKDLEREGWRALDFWEHESPEAIADLIEKALEACAEAA
jgi:DNA (cytosine-5)-methyltransferase 1